MFVMNFSGEARQVYLDEVSYTDREDGQPASGTLTLPIKFSSAGFEAGATIKLRSTMCGIAN